MQKKKMENLNELQLSQSPTVSAAKKEEPVQASDNKLSYEAQKEQNKKIRKLENRLRIVKRLLNVWKKILFPRLRPKRSSREYQN